MGSGRCEVIAVGINIAVIFAVLVVGALYRCGFFDPPPGRHHRPYRGAPDPHNTMTTVRDIPTMRVTRGSVDMVRARAAAILRAKETA